MAENLMPKVAELLGVEVGEEFIIEDADLTITVVLTMNGFNIIRPNNVEESNNNLLLKVLQGLYKVKKKTWEPKEEETFFYPDVFYRNVGSRPWSSNSTVALALKALGMIYRTREEAEEHFVKDYEKLTGVKLSCGAWHLTRNL